MLKKIGSLLRTYITLGTDESTNENDFKKITLLNIFCNTWYLFVIFSFIEDYFQNTLVIYSYVMMFFLILSVQILLYFKRLISASIVFVINLAVTVFLLSNYMYLGESTEYYFILPPIILLIYNDSRIINIAVLIICLLGLLLPNLYFNHYPRSVLNNMNPPFLFFSIFIIISYFKSLNIKNEKKLKAKTNELEALDKFKSQFFTNISHEIRTPLTLINGQISELERFLSESPEIEGVQSRMKKQISTITDMVDNVLDLAKMQSSNFKLQLKSANVSELVRKHYVSFEPLFKQKNIAFSISSTTEDFIAQIDVLFIERAINNIIINALKYTEEGEVSIMINDEHQEKLVIRISDTGIGIAKNDIKTVFNRFYQVNNDINKSGGSGVGLAFSKEIIELHGGELLLESELNIGSTFIIILPLEKTIPAAVSSVATAPVELEEVAISQENVKESAGNFLIVEDNYEMRKYLISILNNYNCFEASNGLEGLGILEREAIDFIITDYMMPKLNGYEFVLKLNEINNSIPVIMLTAKTDTNAKLEVLKLGIDDYITKPFDKEELLVRIDNCMGNHAIRSAYNQENEIKLQEGQGDFINNLKEYVCEKANKQTLSQEEIASKFNFSKSSLYRKIKSQTGLTPNNFINEIRLQKAREILQNNPTILLKQLSLEVGFNHHAYFSKMYAERFGVKPLSKY